MSKKEPSHPKMSRNDRFAQMSHQEKIIEQKKKEILAKLDAKKSSSEATTQEDKSKTSSQDEKNSLNMFSNDGSFLSTFKSMKEKKLDSKLKSFKSRDYGDDRGSKFSKWGQKPSSSPKERIKQRLSRFSDKPSTFEQQKITINTSFNNTLNQQSFDYNAISQQSLEVPIQIEQLGQPLLKNEMIPSHEESYIAPQPTQVPVVPPPLQQSELQVIVSQPVLLTVPPTSQIPAHTLLVSNSDPLNLQPVSLDNLGVVPNQISMTPLDSLSSIGCVPTELASIPPPNPIQVQNIPQPDPINAMNIPPPAPLQVQNIPTPSSLQLNEIPNPKPLDLMAIPTPGDKSLSEAEFLMNIPPPNKSIPPPAMNETSLNMPPPPPPNCVSIVNVQSQPNVQTMAMQSTQSILMHGIQSVAQSNAQMQQTIQNISSAGPQNTYTPVISVALPPGIVSSAGISVTNTIPALMAQPILPPPGMTLNPVQTVNISCPPPLLTLNTSTVQLQSPPPGYVGQVSPIGGQMNQMPPMSLPPPPPPTMSMIGGIGPSNSPDLNAVFPPGTADYEAMASLARMVAQCGPGIQDVVQQRKTQDPSLWFLFHKESAAYRQYQRLIDRFKDELEAEFSCSMEYKPEDAYDPEASGDDDDRYKDVQGSFNCGSQNRRKRKSRWGGKEMNVPSPAVLPPMPMIPVAPIPVSQRPGQMMLSKVNRTDPGLLQYARQTFGSLNNLSEEEWKKAEDHYKINLLYQDMVRKREEVEILQASGKNKYDYDSDEEIDGGTWEHKLREKEMMATQLWAAELTRQAEGKHHIGDFLPPEEFKRFIEKSNAAKEGRQLNFSDYKEFKIKEDNIGFKMLQKLGWTEGTGLGAEGKGIVDPVNKAPSRDLNQGLGMTAEDYNDDDEYESYRKRMMLAYRFRPNPLNNPRRPYY